MWNAIEKSVKFNFTFNLYENRPKNAFSPERKENISSYKELEGSAAATQSQHSYKYENRYTIYEIPLYQNYDATHTPSDAQPLEHKQKQIEFEKRTKKKVRPILEIIDRFVDACLPWDDGKGPAAHVAPPHKQFLMEKRTENREHIVWGLIWNVFWLIDVFLHQATRRHYRLSVVLPKTTFNWEFNSFFFATSEHKNLMPSKWFAATWEK